MNVLCVILAIAVFLLCVDRFHIKNEARIRELKLKIDLSDTLNDRVKAEAAYDALEIGMNEIEEGYQQDILTLDENAVEMNKTIDEQRIQIIDLEFDKTIHDMFCLPSYKRSFEDA